MKSFIVALLAVAGLWAGEAWGQVDSLWTRTYGGDRPEECNSLIQTSDGGYALAGFTGSFGSGGADYWLLKTDENGDSLWSRSFGGSGDDVCYSLIQTRDGGFALAGYTWSFGNGYNDYWLVRTDANGDSLWSCSYGGISYEYCYSMCETDDGGFALVGSTYSFGAGSSDFWLVRTDEDGDSLWAHTYGGIGEDLFRSFVVTTDGGFALAGSQESQYGHVLLVKTDGIGNESWSFSYGRPTDQVFALIQTMDRGFALAGTGMHGDQEGNPVGDGWLLLTGEHGDSLLYHIYAAGWGKAILRTYDEGFVLGGSLEGPMLARVTRSGDGIWYVYIRRSLVFPCNSLIKTSEGGYAMAGYTVTQRGMSDDFFLLKTTPDPVSVSDPPNIAFPSSFSLSAFPNPFNSSLNISFQSARPGLVALDLIDPTGRQVARLFDGFAPAGERRVVWNAAGMPAGMYMVKMVNGEGAVAVKPITLVK